MRWGASTPIQTKGRWGATDWGYLHRRDRRLSVTGFVLLFGGLAAVEAVVYRVARFGVTGSATDGVGLPMATFLVVGGLAGAVWCTFVVRLARYFRIAPVAWPLVALVAAFTGWSLVLTDGIVEGPGYLAGDPASYVSVSRIARLLEATRGVRCVWVTVGPAGFVPLPYERCVREAPFPGAGIISFINNPGTTHASGFVYSSGVTWQVPPNTCVRRLDVDWVAVVVAHYFNAFNACPYPYTLVR